jgi:16S rRNA C1402 N4-methylase RsmH
MRAIRPVDLAHQIIAEVLNADDIAIDATVGNGHDTAFLARRVGSGGQVYGFDIQSGAIRNTESLLKVRKLLDRVELFQTGHENLSTCIPQRHWNTIRAAMFNLGYLPGGDKQLTTCTESSLIAVKSAVKLISTGGRISILCYPGHPGGQEETQTIKTYARSLANEFKVTIHAPVTEIKRPPELIIIEKKGLS